MKIAVLDDYQDAAAAHGAWDSLGAEVDFVHEHLTGDDLVDRVADRDVLVCMRERTPIGRALLDRLPALRLVVTTGMRNASIDGAALAERGIPLCGTRAWIRSTTELTWALILGLVRPVLRDDRHVRSGGWQDSVGGDLAGRTLGVVGLGRQGSAVAAIALAFGMDVQAWSANLTAERAAEAGVTAVSKQELFETSDIVSLHLVLSERSRGVVGEPELRAMRRDAYLVNSARAALVDQDALRRALTEGWIRGAALDVFDTEPLPAGHWLRSAPRTLLSPHMGYVSEQGYRTFYGDAVEDIRAWADGTPIRVIKEAS
ncbi:D-2-hydroxyacid dehydrogenase family protein [Amycolatopsis sp. NPDC001319]|uniref:D-2-hydroxyacid dehydrogenase family protein n=1 Tax=unclassified Amycolatopsis TaxID=2618356 RepID=UPI0036882019